MPTDTVYGIACDAFSPAAVAHLLSLKGRGAQMPPPVLVASPDEVFRLASDVPEGVGNIIDSLWPGGVTIIVRANPDLGWDLGEIFGTVALRMPDNDVALELLALTGPLAVSSANLTGTPAATTLAEAREHFGESIPVYLDGGPVGERYRGGSGNSGSTIVDATALEAGGPWRVVRHGVVAWHDVQAVAGGEWEQ